MEKFSYLRDTYKKDKICRSGFSGGLSMAGFIDTSKAGCLNNVKDGYSIRKMVLYTKANLCVSLSVEQEGKDSFSGIFWDAVWPEGDIW